MDDQVKRPCENHHNQ